MYASFILGYHTSLFQIESYSIDANTGMVTLYCADGDEVLVHISRVIIYK